MNDRPPPYRTVVFDCDSTLSAIEGIDELARRVGADVSDLTRAAMSGEVPLEDVYAERLERIRPSRADVEAVGRSYIEHALPHGRELVAALRALEKRVCVVSGGLLPPVRDLARHLGIDAADVFAVDVDFAADGAYAGFDRASPLARAGGKIDVLRALVDGPDRGPAVLVGDGVTDLEAAAVVARFVAFGGVERRAEVFGRAVVTCDTPDLAALVPLLLAEDEVCDLGR